MLLPYLLALSLTHAGVLKNAPAVLGDGLSQALAVFHGVEVPAAP